MKKAATKKVKEIMDSDAKEKEPAKKAVSAKAVPLTPAKQEKLIAENAVLKADIAKLKEENAKLKKAIADLTK